MTAPSAPARLRRAIHFVPGGNEKMLAKALTLPADSLILDLEAFHAWPGIGWFEGDGGIELLNRFLQLGRVAFGVLPEAQPIDAIAGKMPIEPHACEEDKTYRDGEDQAQQRTHAEVMPFDEVCFFF